MKEELRFIPFLSHQRIASTVEGLAKKITEDYADTVPVVIGVLKGAALFTADLVRRLPMELELDFIQVERYGKYPEPQPTITIVHDVTFPLKDRDVLIVEDIVDRGITIKALKEHIERKGARSVKVCTLLLREGSPAKGSIEYAGIGVDKGFVVGYGMDYREKFRNLDALYIMEEG